MFGNKELTELKEYVECGLRHIKYQVWNPVTKVREDSEVPINLFPADKEGYGAQLNIDEQIYIEPEEVEQDNPFLRLSYIKDVWIVSRAILVPGVRYYKDGSGEPDSVDIVELVTTPLTTEAAANAVIAFFSDLVTGDIDSLAESKDWEKDRANYDWDTGGVGA